MLINKKILKKVSKELGNYLLVVLPIWEGTTNVLSLDVLRSVFKSQGQVLKAFHASVSEKLSKASSSHPTLKILSEQVQSSMNTLLSPQNYELLSDSLPARDLAFTLATVSLSFPFAERYYLPVSIFLSL
ncbi:hypothetical protein ACROYT_G008730 [Oculina patagonica]